MIPLRPLLLAALAVTFFGVLAFRARPAAESIPEVKRTSAPAVGATVTDTPEEAATRALARPAEQRLMAAATLLIDTADDPTLAEQIARRFCREDPEHIREYGDALILVLAEHDEFAQALHFAELGGPERSYWLAHALQLWTQKDPARAVQATLALDNGEGFTVVATAWADRDPDGLADYVLRPRAADFAALETALNAWREQNPETVSAWLDRLD